MTTLPITIFSPDNIYSYGAMIVAGVLENAGYNVNLTRKFSLGEAKNSDIVGFSLSSTLHLVGKTAELINNLKAHNNPFIVVGGPVSIDPELIFSCLPAIDAVVIGEGEETIRELVEAVRLRKNLDLIAGIAFKQDGKIVNTEKRPPYKLGNSPIPKIPADIGEQSIRGANVYFETHRGCLANCAFCLIPKFFGQRNIRSKTIPQIKREIRAFILKGAIRVAIGSGNIALYGIKDHKINEEKVEQMLETVSSVVSPVNFAAPDLRVDMIPDRILRAVKKHTYGLIIFGMESGSDHVLKLMRKGITVQKINEAIERSEKIGLAVAGAFITGYPGEEEEHFQETKEFIESKALSDYTVSLPEPIPGTDLAKTVLELPEKKNPVFMQDETKIGQKYGFTVAERRCFELLLSASTSRKVPLYLTDLLMKDLVNVSKQQGEEIRQITQILKQHSK
ncbi:MAG: TIGR04014 family B12-binding domain/radical SAM domain-containing protein [Candidatus Helarchaeota archaeon]|nr:TIGR04014 family B12-binding domain/radical SAM domain-containing protein [Candidatus Helarchaeota archaeon]